MESPKENEMNNSGTVTQTVADASQSKPTSSETRIHWASPMTSKPELEAQFEAMRARNWITERMVNQYQKHWHCSREEALERLLSKAGS